MRAQVERDAREARKHRVRLCLASQRLDDFGEALVELSNRIWVLGAGGKAGELETLSKLFALSETVAEAVGFRLTGPGPEGAPALLIAVDGRGRFEQLVVNTPGPVELWALTTSPRDAALRERLHERLAPAEARADLARRFPAGSARPWIEAALRRLELRGARVAASERDLLESLADELAHDRGTPWHTRNPGTPGPDRPRRCTRVFPCEGEDDRSNHDERETEAMMAMNRATLMGHAGRNPEIRKLPSGDDVAQFSLATTERFRRKDDTVGESTKWHQIVAFGAAAEAVRKLVRKGELRGRRRRGARCPRLFEGPSAGPEAVDPGHRHRWRGPAGMHGDAARQHR